MEPDALTRLKKVAGEQTTTLTHFGHKTGKPHEVTIWFVLDDDRLFIGTANVNRQWVRNVQKTPQIRLSIAGESFDGTARFLTDRAEHERAMAAIRGKYWMFRPIIELGRLLAALGVMHDNTGSFEVTLAARPNLPLTGGSPSGGSHLFPNLLKRVTLGDDRAKVAGAESIWGHSRRILRTRHRNSSAT
jgi:deazaflavin-dependent oxidoreductase (nitroreductase family)